MKMESKIKQIIKTTKKRTTQRGIAKKIGISEQYLSLILSGSRKCPEWVRVKLERILKNEL